MLPKFEFASVRHMSLIDLLEDFTIPNLSEVWYITLKLVGDVNSSDLFGFILITLKLAGYISWSWLWVLSPFWIPFVFAISVMSI